MMALKTLEPVCLVDIIKNMFGGKWCVRILYTLRLQGALNFKSPHWKTHVIATKILNEPLGYWIVSDVLQCVPTNHPRQKSLFFIEQGQALCVVLEVSDGLAKQ